MKFAMILFVAAKLYSSESNQINKAEFIYCLRFFKDNHLENTQAFKDLISRNQDVYDKYMKRNRKVTFNSKDDICQF